jgi:hypothetical protein
MRAFAPQGIPGNQRPARVNQLPITYGTMLRQLPAVISNPLPDETELRQLPIVYGNKLYQFPAIDGE